MENNNRKFGALWKKVKNEKEYLSGEIIVNDKKIKIICFQRDKKRDIEPDWDILTAIEPNQGIKI